MTGILVFLLFTWFSPAEEWRPLFDGRTLTGWAATKFGGEGEVAVRNGTITLATGSNMTGITWTGGELPRSRYEIELEAARESGGDFFCGLTFPVGDSHCSFVVGGWGGSIVGLSSLDGLDASENETSTSMTFETHRWYRIRVRVLDDAIGAWIDDKPVVDVSTKGRRVSVRIEMWDSRPLGVATWMTSAALRNIRIRDVR